jgi:hypothetical protein
VIGRGRRCHTGLLVSPARRRHEVGSGREIDRVDLSSERDEGFACDCVTILILSAGSSAPEPLDDRSRRRARRSPDVAPILYKNRTGCHRPGEIGPIALTYDDVVRGRKTSRQGRRWRDAALARRQVTGKFPTIAASDEDRATLLRWANNGAPKGDDNDPPPIPKCWKAGRSAEPMRSSNAGGLKLRTVSSSGI